MMSGRQRKRFSRGARRRLTRVGWLFVGMILLLGAVLLVGPQQMRDQSAMVFMFLGAMIGAVVVSCLLAGRMTEGVDVRREVASRVWQNQTVHFGYYIANRRRMGSCLGLSVEEVSPDGIESASGYCVHLPPRALFRAGTRFAAGRRGRIDLKGLRICTSFPFGLITAVREIILPASLVVWPARGSLRVSLLRRGAVEVSSSSPSRVKGGADEFFGIREYHTDDNPRWIHWRKSAGLARPIVREMARPLPEELWVVLDTLLESDDESRAAELERAIRFAATLVDHAFARGYQVAVALGMSDGVVVHAPAAGRGQRRTLLDVLAEVDHNTTHDLDETIGRIPRWALSESQAIVIASDPAKFDATALRSACRHLTVIGWEGIAGVFEDNPVAVEAAPCP